MCACIPYCIHLNICGDWKEWISPCFNISWSGLTARRRYFLHGFGGVLAAAPPSVEGPVNLLYRIWFGLSPAHLRPVSRMCISSIALFSSSLPK